MKLYIILLVLSCGILADKEVPEAFADELSEKLIVEIQKRLDELGWSTEDDVGGGVDADSEVYSTIDGNTCAYQVSESTIIQTDESLQAGATFIRSEIDDPSRLTRASCQEECCKESECNLAVLKEKGDKYACYMFNCGNPSVCNFTGHSGFTAFMMEGKMENVDVGDRVGADVDKHEEDLAQLTAGGKTTMAPTAAPTTVTTSTPTTTTTSTTTTSSALVKELVQLFGECTDNQDCAGGGTICLAGYCICDDNYHAQDGLCRKDCNKFQFKCANEGQPLTMPQCIAIYDTCDNIRHCADGSDELHCDSLNKDTASTGSQLSPATENKQAPSQWSQGGGAAPYFPLQQQSPDYYQHQPQGGASPNVNPAISQYIPSQAQFQTSNQIAGQMPAGQQNIPWQQYYDSMGLLQQQLAAQGQAQNQPVPNQMPAKIPQLVPQGVVSPQQPVPGTQNQQMDVGRVGSGTHVADIGNGSPNQSPVNTGNMSPPLLHPAIKQGAMSGGPRPDSMHGDQTHNGGMPHIPSGASRYDAAAAAAAESDNNSPVDDGRGVGGQVSGKINGGGSQLPIPGSSNGIPHSSSTGDHPQIPMEGAMSSHHGRLTDPRPDSYPYGPLTNPESPSYSDNSYMPSNPSEQLEPKHRFNIGRHEDPSDYGRGDIFGNSYGRSHGGYHTGDDSYMSDGSRHGNPNTADSYPVYNLGPYQHGGGTGNGGGVDRAGYLSNYGNPYYNYIDPSASKPDFVYDYSMEPGPSLSEDKIPAQQVPFWEYYDTPSTGNGRYYQLDRPSGGNARYPSDSPSPSSGWNGYKGGNNGGKHHGGDRNGGYGGGLGRGGGRGDNWRHKIHSGTTEAPPSTDDVDFVDTGMSEPVGEPHSSVDDDHDVPDHEDQGNTSSQDEGTPSDSKHSTQNTEDSSKNKQINNANSGDDVIATEPPAEKVTVNAAPTTTTAAAAASVKTPDSKPSNITKSGNVDGAIIIVSPDNSVLEDSVNPVYVQAQTNKTAVLVLAMGLAITALLLIFVGCRLRTVKRRIRRGRPLNSNEADYLINGMYL